MPDTGEKPEKGVYACIKCGQTVAINDETDTLPVCPKCGCTVFRPSRF